MTSSINLDVPTSDRFTGVTLREMIWLMDKETPGRCPSPQALRWVYFLDVSGTNVSVRLS